jgi:hypothetical protein
VRFWSDEIEGTGFTADISDTGLLIETPKPLELGQRLHLEVSLNEGSYFAECVIVRRKTYPRHARALFKPAIGVRFLGLSEVAGVASAPDDEVPERAASVETAEASARVEGSTDPVPVEVPRGPMQVDLRELADLGHCRQGQRESTERRGPAQRGQVRARPSAGDPLRPFVSRRGRSPRRATRRSFDARAGELCSPIPREDG